MRKVVKIHKLNKNHKSGMKIIESSRKLQKQREKIQREEKILIALSM